MDRNYAAVRSAERVEKFVEKFLREGKPVGFDIEAGYVGPDQEGVSFMQFHPNYRLVGFSFTNSLEWARYVPVAHDDGNNVDDIPRTARAIWKLLKSGLIVAHNLSYEYKGLSRWLRETLPDDEEIQAARGYFPFRSDTMIEAFLLQEYDPFLIGKDLKSLVQHIFGHKMVHFEELFPLVESELGPPMKRGKGRFNRFNTRNSQAAKVISYACEDALWCLALHYKHWPRVKDSFIYKIEMELLPVPIEMEREGLLVDWNVVHQKAQEIDEFAVYMNEEIQAELTERLGEPININLGSAKQLSTVLFEKMGLPVKIRSKKTNAASTGDPALRAIAKVDPIIKKILEYRQVKKLFSSYLHKYETQLNYMGNGRAIPNHNQIGAGTGRFSVDQVSYQQWPKPYHFELASGKAFDFTFRDLLLSPPGWRIVGFDYSQIELRVLAGVAVEDDLLEAFRTGIDVHKLTASRMLGIPFEEVTKQQRQVGKTLNFAIVYGAGPDLLADMLTAEGVPTTKDGAIELLKKYYAAFPKLRAWMDARIVEGHEQGWVSTLFGRKYEVWEYHSTKQFIRNKGDRLCVNAPIQGGAADLLKIGMVRMSKALVKAGLQDLVRPFMTIHDSIEFYVHESVDTQTVIDVVNPAISFAVNHLPTLPEIRADWHEGRKWGSLLDIKLDSYKTIMYYEIDGVKDKTFLTPEEGYAYQAALPQPEHKEAVIVGIDDFLAEDEDEDNEYVEDTPMALVLEKPEPQAPSQPGFPTEPGTAPPSPWHEPTPPLPGEEPEDIVPGSINATNVLPGLIPVSQLAPDPTEEEPVWLHSQIIVRLVEMPTGDQYDAFLASLKPGSSSVILSTPEGEIALEGYYTKPDLTPLKEVLA